MKIAGVSTPPTQPDELKYLREVTLVHLIKLSVRVTFIKRRCATSE